MNTPIRGRTIDRRQGRIVIRTALGTQMSFEDNGLPLFIPVLVLYDYTINQIKDVVEDHTNYATDIQEPEEDIDDDIDIEKNCGVATTDDVDEDNYSDTEEQPDEEDLYY